MTFDVQNVDLDQLAEVLEKGGIAALEELAATGKAPEFKPEEGETPEKDEAGTEEAAGEGAKADPTTDEAKVEPAKPDAQEKEHATAVSTKDGKGTIPYSVLKGARERATQVDQQNEILRKQISDLTTRLEHSTPAEAAAATEVATVEVDDKIATMQAKAEQLKGDFPELAELLAGQIEMLQATRKQLTDLQAEREAELTERNTKAQAQVEETIQEAIDGNPVLSLWSEKAGPEWKAAVEMDAMLREKPEWGAKTFSERFTKVVELVRVLNPEFEVPAPAPEPVLDPASKDVKPQVPASDKRPPVNSLSDIPGGVLPSAGKREQIEELSGAALGNRFSSMTTDQINEYLASLGT